MPIVKVIDISFDELRERWLQARREGRWQSQEILDGCAAIWADDSDGEWAGGTGADTERWLLEGYFQPAFALNALNVEPRPRSRATWNEEDGDLDPGRLYGGADEFYLGQADRDAIPGVTIEAEYNFGAASPPETVAQYGDWITSLASALEAEGYDLEIVLVIRTMDLFRYQAMLTRTDIRLTVKEAGTVSDFTNWSALLAPTGFRHLIFAAFGLAADALDLQLANGLGGPVSSGWGCEMEGGLISITCDSRGAYEIPIEQLNAEAKAAGILQ